MAQVFDFHDHYRGISAVTFDWDLEINNNEFVADEQIIEAIQSINNAEGE